MSVTMGLGSKQKWGLRSMSDSLINETGGKQTNLTEVDVLGGGSAPGIRDLERWLKLEPAPQPALFNYESEYPVVDLRAATGKNLPAVSEQRVIKSGLETSGSALAALAGKMAISEVTGCWVDVDAWRDDKGYSFTMHPEEVGIEPLKKLRWPGARLHTIAHLLLMRIHDPEYQKPEGIDLDHMCCFPGCCNPHHTEGVSKKENNRRQRLAAQVARPLMLGQTIIGPTSIEWIDEAVSATSDED